MSVQQQESNKRDVNREPQIKAINKFVQQRTHEERELPSLSRLNDADLALLAQAIHETPLAPRKK